MSSSCYLNHILSRSYKITVFSAVFLSRQKTLHVLFACGQVKFSLNSSAPHKKKKTVKTKTDEPHLLSHLRSAVAAQTAAIVVKFKLSASTDKSKNVAVTNLSAQHLKFILCKYAEPEYVTSHCSSKLDSPIWCNA